MDQTVSLSSFKCPWCDYKHARINSLRIHASKLHKCPAQELYDAMFHPTGRPTCKCGCGQEVGFYGVESGYVQFVKGHVARVRNNWGHNEKALGKSHEARRESFKQGEWKAWNVGLTKEDPRVQTYAEKCSATFTPEKREQYSERLRTNRLSGRVPTLRAADHPNWKGGLSSINNLAHSLLYKAWIFPKMKAGNFACSSCGSKEDLCVHHSGERFSTLLREAASQVGYDGLVHDDDFDKKSEVAQRLVDLHLERDVPGVVFCRECHAQAHEALGEPNEAAVIRSRAS